MFFIVYAVKGQVYVFAGRVKIVSQLSCRTSAILKYFCPLGFKFDYYNITDLTTGLTSRCAAVIWKDRGHPITVIVTGIFVSSSFPI